MELIETRHSYLDQSVNFVFQLFNDPLNIVEARFVRRSPEYICCYLSSQTGCQQGCRMCHLTATKQTRIRHLENSHILRQAETVLNYYKNEVQDHSATKVHFNFMARGEPLVTNNFLLGSQDLFLKLGELARKIRLCPRFSVSTIMPKSLDDFLPVVGGRLSNIFTVIHPDIYYSLYSMRENFRKKWLPNALPAAQALDLLKDWQQDTGKVPKIHWAFIEGENDSENDIDAIVDNIRDRDLLVNVNIVRYNPYSPEYGKEPNLSKIEDHANWIQGLLPQSKVKIVDRVGVDVAASCGTFV